MQILQIDLSVISDPLIRLRAIHCMEYIRNKIVAYVCKTVECQWLIEAFDTWIRAYGDTRHGMAPLYVGHSLMSVFSFQLL